MLDVSSEELVRAFVDKIEDKQDALKQNIES
jgi:orotidine-5'-phosphate decarboxylase